ncbi:uncharacterized protein LOC134242248 isoform X2 [Saccostrea cucullata]|uniref:uncharacterized protein LOC134242248 isoform X2 n=1 Tax=Saccostrea cuccullata TaxID=36930 RepID=UPI002ED24C01
MVYVKPFSVVLCSIFQFLSKITRATNRPVNDRDREFLYQKLTTVGRFSAMHWILSPEPPVPTLAVPLVEDLISSQEFISAENPIAWMKQRLMINEQEIQQIACLTTGQKENCMWSSVRKNRLTASNFGCVLAAIKRNRYPVSLYKRLCSAYDLSKKDAIIWGTCNEKVAIEKYRTFGDAVVEPTGIWLHCNGVLGSSPDGLIRRPAAFGFSYQNPGLADILEMSNVKPEILEVKCPFSAKNMTIPEAIEKVHDFCLGNNSVGSGF